MHTGRQYRAAIPRYASVDFPYSRGVPANFFLFGNFGYSGGFVAIPAATFRSPSIAYDDATATWQWTFTLVGDDGNVYGAVVADRLKTGSPGRQRNYVIGDAFGSVMAVEHHYVPDDVSTWESYEANQNNTIFTVSGAFDPAFLWECRAILYPDE